MSDASPTFRGNCVLVALWHWLTVPGTRLGWMRNRAGRWHCYWITGGVKYEFHTPGASSRTYLQNAWRMGTVRRIRTSGADSGRREAQLLKEGAPVEGV